MRGQPLRRLQGIVDDMAAALFPATCRQCGAALPERPGRAAPRAARPYSALYSGRLRRRVAGSLSLPFLVLCARCCTGIVRVRRPGLVPGAAAVPCATAFEPAPAVFDLVHALKYEGALELAPWLGAHLAAAARRDLGGLRGATLVPVPLHSSRLAERGFNQSLLLARAAAERLGLPVCEAVLERRRPTRHQARLPHAERQANVADAFVRRGSLPDATGPFILVDDVVTTGATVRAALAALTGRAAVLALCRAREVPHPPLPGARDLC